MFTTNCQFFRLELCALLFCGWAIIDLMGGPLRYNKKERKRLRRFARKAAIAAEKFETEGIKPNAVAVLRRLAESNKAIAKARKKKKPKNLN